jgi:hypothetical protein
MSTPLLSPERFTNHPTKTFQVVAVSSNANSFGLTGIVLAACDGEAFEAAHYQGLHPLTKGQLVSLAVIAPEAEGVDRYLWADTSAGNFEIPRALPPAPEKLRSELFPKGGAK